MAVHLGILQTDHVLPQFRAEHGDYADMFHSLFREVAADATFTDYDVQLSVPDEIVCDAYVITGSRCSVYDELEWIPPLVDFLGRVLAAGKKIIGICFGHQLMAHYFGGRVGPAAAGWGVGVQESRVSRHQPWMKGQADTMALLCSHKDQVMALPDDAGIFLSSDFCPIGGFTMADQVITVQGHPEFRKGYSKALMDMRAQQLGEQVYQAGLRSLQRETTERIMAAWLLEFVRSTQPEID